MNFHHPNSLVLERFCRYVAIDTQSDANSTTFPSTEKQKNLARLLVQELKDLGVSDAEIDEWGYVYATIPASLGNEHLPAICFCAHMDTSPDCSGKDVKPVVHRNYQGQDLILPGDVSQVLKPSEHPELLNQIGQDIVTADGTTLLGADNKAGVAEIMEAARYWMLHPEVPHGRIRLLFTPDEEIGRGTDHVDLKKLDAAFGYTLDGETLGHLENETFSADGFKLTFLGKSAHPGFAKGHMISALRLWSEWYAQWPTHELRPESTEAKEPFMHVVATEGSIEKVICSGIIRSFDTAELNDIAAKIKSLAQLVCAKYPGSAFELEVYEQYRNMKEILDRVPHVTELAIEAIRQSDLTPVLSSIRGGTDGSRLSFMGLPCPNIFAGEHAFHSKLEWVSVRDMEKAVEVIVRLAALFTTTSRPE